MHRRRWRRGAKRGGCSLAAAEGSATPAKLAAAAAPESDLLAESREAGRSDDTQVLRRLASDPNGPGPHMRARSRSHTGTGPCRREAMGLASGGAGEAGGVELVLISLVRSSTSQRCSNVVPQVPGRPAYTACPLPSRSVNQCTCGDRGDSRGWHTCARARHRCPALRDIRASSHVHRTPRMVLLLQGANGAIRRAVLVEVTAACARVAMSRSGMERRQRRLKRCRAAVAAAIDVGTSLSGGAGGRCGRLFAGPTATADAGRCGEAKVAEAWFTGRATLVAPQVVRHTGAQHVAPTVGVPVSQGLHLAGAQHGGLSTGASPTRSGAQHRAFGSMWHGWAYWQSGRRRTSETCWIGAHNDTSSPAPRPKPRPPVKSKL